MTNKRHTTLFISFLLLISVSSFSQDIQFSQFYQVPLYQNPAFAGSAHKARATVHQRIQWPSLDAKYTTSFMSFDGYKKQYRSGFGGYILHDQQGHSSISSTQIAGQYAYELHLNSRYTLRMGMQLGWTFQSIDYSILTFPSQFNEDGLINSGPTFNNDLVNFVDASSGFVLYTPYFWIGFSAHHMNTPNISFLNDVSNLPIKLAFTGGYKFLLKHDQHRGLAVSDDREVSITPTFQYKTQGTSDQLDIGTYFLYHQFVSGLWYRGIPTKKYSSDYHNSESVVFLFGIKLKSIGVTYSYDWTVSTLSAANSGGSHELNLAYVFGQETKKRKPTKRMPCPSFYVH